MYKVEWDEATGGVLLSSRITDRTLGFSPRPVFYEELDLLGLNKLGWIYPHSEEPIMWAINKQYWYRGNLLFEAKGANIFDMPTVIFTQGVEPMELTPVDVDMMISKNSDSMFLIESEALEFIRDIYVTYAGVNRAYHAIQANRSVDYEALAAKVEKKTKTKMAVVKEDCDSFDIVPLEKASDSGKRVLLSTRIDRFLASFSGGKDSQIILDLCTRAIPPTEFEVIYSDTGYELPSSLKLYDQVQQYYKKRFPALKFSTVKNHESVLNYWDKIGTPSDTHRWCCSVMKTAPLYRSLKIEGNQQARVLTFDGVRAEESVRRRTYNRIGKGVKHSTVINASPILQWNAVEVFLYLFKYKLPLNPAYRFGVTRVGCVLCPFSSEWNDMVIHRRFEKTMAPFLDKVESYVSKLSIPDPVEYIKTGNWKRRAGGRDLTPDSQLEIVSSKPDLVVELHNCHKNITTWFHAIGDLSGNEKSGSIRFQGTIFTYNTISKNGKLYITFPRSSYNALFQGLVKRALYKACYCINCEVCEVECPTGALSILPEPKIEKSKCIHCHRCLTFHDSGCIVANSLKKTNSKSNKMKLIGYNNFGLREEWLDYFMMNYDTYFDNNDHGLQVKQQLPSFVKWLVHAKVLDDAKNKNLTEMGRTLIQIYQDNPSLVWEIIWLNLTYESPIVRWYSQSVPFSREIEDSELRAMVKNDYPDMSDTTIKNIVYALLRTLNESPIGEDICEYVPIEKNIFIRRPCSDLSLEALAYSLYTYGEKNETRELRVSTLLADKEDGPRVEFGIEQNNLLKMLRSLQLAGVLTAELNMGLDHISLQEEKTALQILQEMTR